MANFTPGPWSVERIDYEKYGLDASYEVNAGFQTIAQTHMREIKTESGQLRTDEANCRLIAAAPALYEALRDCHMRLQTASDFRNAADNAALAKGSAALSLALGEKQGG